MEFTKNTKTHTHTHTNMLMEHTPDILLYISMRNCEYYSTPTYITKIMAPFNVPHQRPNKQPTHTITLHPSNNCNNHQVTPNYGN
jgi:hypothetical protein